MILSCARHGTVYMNMKKKIIITATAIICCSKLNAQYYNPYVYNQMFDYYYGGPGSVSWQIQQQQILNQNQMYIDAMRQQQLQYYRQQANNLTNWITKHPFDAYPGAVYTRDGFKITYELVNAYHADGECYNCNGKGYLHEKYYAGDHHIKTYNRRCGVCHGTGQY